MGDEIDSDQQKGLRRRQASSVSERNGKIWHSLGEIFGVRWVNSYGDKPGKIWCQLFDSLTDAQIHQGIAHFANEDREHPPGTGNFKAVCLLHTPAQAQARDAVDDMSHYATGANRVMMTIVMEKNGVSDYALDKLLNEKRRLVDQYEVMDADKEIKVDWEKFIGVIDDRLRTVLAKVKPR